MGPAVVNRTAETRMRSPLAAARRPAVVGKAAETRMSRDDAADLLSEYGITPTAQRIDIAAVRSYARSTCARRSCSTCSPGTAHRCRRRRSYNTLGLSPARDSSASSSSIPTRCATTPTHESQSHLRYRHRCSDRHRAWRNQCKRAAGLRTPGTGGRRRDCHQGPPVTLSRTDAGARSAPWRSILRALACRCTLS